MRRFFVCVLLLFGFLYFSYSASCAIEDRERSEESESSHVQEEVHKKPQPSRPILPPTVPSSSSGISPTPSPHIATPPVVAGEINKSSTASTSPQVHLPATLPSTPTRVILPDTNLPKIPQIPTVPNAPNTHLQPRVPQIAHSYGVPLMHVTGAGVLAKGIDKDGSPWIELESELFNEPVKMRVYQGTAVKKKDMIMGLDDIKAGDIVNIVFRQIAGKNTAISIQILEPEDLIRMLESSQTQEVIEEEEPLLQEKLGEE